MHRRDLLKTSLILLATTSSASLAGAMQDGVTTRSKPARNVFTRQQNQAIALLADMIIPTTDTSGALAAGVPDFIATIASEWYNSIELDIFLHGLALLDTHCQKSEGRGDAKAGWGRKYQKLRCRNARWCSHS